MDSILSRCIVAVAALLMMSLIAGCGGPSDAPELADVYGTVTLDGEPVSGATIMLEPSGNPGRPAVAMTNEEGYYEVKYARGTYGAMLGSHLVRISTFEEAYDDGEFHPAKPERIPAKYNVQAQDNPEMTVEVKAGGNEFNFKLDSEGEIMEPPEEIE